MAVRSLSSASISTGAKRSKFWDQSAAVFDSDYFSIASYSVSNTTTATFDFQNIPQDYKHLQIRLFGQGASSDDSVIKFNNDGGTSYSWHELRGNGSSVGVSGTANLSPWTYIGRTPPNTTGDYYGVVIADIMDYTRTDRNKMFYSIEGNEIGSSGIVGTMSGIWSSDAAVNRLTISLQGGYWSQYSECGLYGLKGN